MHFAGLLSIPNNISSMKWETHVNGVDDEPPEKVIVYYSAGADVNIHTTGHFPFVCTRTHPPRLMESVEAAVLFSQKLGISHTFQLPSGNWMQHCSVQTSRWQKASTQQCKLVGRKCKGVSNKSASRLNTSQEHFISMFPMFIYSPDWTHWGCP